MYAERTESVYHSVWQKQQTAIQNNPVIQFTARICKCKVKVIKRKSRLLQKKK